MKNKEKRKKENKVPRLVSLVLVMTLITTCLLSSTLAKYVKTVSGTDTARVAQFDFTGTLTTDSNETDNTNQSLGAATSVNIFSTAYDNSASTITVESSDGKKVVAPGVQGSLVLKATGGAAEVMTKFSITLAETNAANIPMLYLYDGDYYSNQYSTGTTHYLVISDDGTTRTPVTVAGNLAAMATAMTNATGAVSPGSPISFTSDTLEWYWPFEEWDAATNGSLIASGVGSDVYDTALGAVGTATVKLDVAVKGVQVD